MKSDAKLVLSWRNAKKMHFLLAFLSLIRIFATENHKNERKNTGSC